jgi:hypothetical protein
MFQLSYVANYPDNTDKELSFEPSTQEGVIACMDEILSNEANASSIVFVVTRCPPQQ